jgi:8-oxo-dGTP pyrophosphatase MutT (NUDIX family)
MINKIRRLLGLESYQEQIDRYCDIKKSFEDVDLELDQLAQDFYIEKSQHDARLRNPDNAQVVDRIKARFDTYLVEHRGRLRETKRQYDTLRSDLDRIEKSLNNHKYIRKEPDGKGGWEYIYGDPTIEKAIVPEALKEEEHYKDAKKESGKTKYADFMLFNERVELLLLKRSDNDKSNPGAWVLPGGHVDQGEDFYEAAMRELREESGYDVPKCDHVGSYEDDKAHIEYFAAQVSDQELPALQWEEARDMCWVPLDEVKDYEMVFNMRDNVMKILGEMGYRVETEATVIHKAIMAGLISLEDVIEKAKDVSKLKKIKKLVLRDGKLVFGTYYVKTGEFIPDEDKVGERYVVESDVAEGDKVYISTRKKGVEGYVTGFSFKKDSKTHWVGVLTDDGKSELIEVSKMTRLKKVSDKPETETKKDSIGKFRDLRYSDLSLLASLGGSSEVKLMTDSDGMKYAVKKARDRAEGKGQLKDEFIADSIYAAMGFSAPISKLTDDEQHKIAYYLEGYRELGALSGDEFKEAKAKLKEGFVLDCLLANWDVIGAGEDNILVRGDSVVRVDNGGALRYRARGGDKTSLFTKEVSELVTLRDSSRNPSTAEIFGDITDEEIRNQVKTIVSQKTHIINTANKTSGGDSWLANRLSERIDWLAENYGEETTPKKTAEKKEPEKKLRPDMPSLVTQDYFDNGWDELELEGNPGIKEHIKNHIVEIENSHKSRYEDYARKHGLTVEEYKKQAQQVIEQAVSRSNFFITVHSQPSSGDKSILEKIFTKNGRFKSQFETDSSMGSHNPEARSRTEHEYFGFKNEVRHDRDKRPVYGYWSPNGNGVINSKGTIPPPNRVSQYGDVNVEIKREVAMKKATITFKDSLGSSYEITASPAAKPHFTSYYGDVLSYLKPKLSSGSESTNFSEDNYVEAQYHNQLNLSDVKTVHMTHEAFEVYRADKERRSMQMKKLTYAINNMTKFAAETGTKDINIEIF